MGSYICLIVDHQLDSSTSAHSQVLQGGFQAVLFPLRLYYKSPAPALLTVTIIPSLINSLEKKDLSNQTNLECSAEVSRLKRRKIGSANYLLRYWEAGTLVYLFFKKEQKSRTLKNKNKKKTLKSSALSSPPEKDFYNFFFKNFEDRINELHCSTETRVF